MEPERGLKLEVGLNPCPVLCVLLFGGFAVTSLPGIADEHPKSIPNPTVNYPRPATLDIPGVSQSAQSFTTRKTQCFFRETPFRLINVGSAQGNNHFRMF